jgi:hypothetical protein
VDESLGEEVLLLLFRHPGNMARSGETANLTFDVTRDELCLQREVQSAGSYTDVIAPSPGELFSETNDNSVTILLSYGTATITLPEDVGVYGEASLGDVNANGFRLVDDAHVNGAYGESDVTLSLSVEASSGDINLRLAE